MTGTLERFMKLFTGSRKSHSFNVPTDEITAEGKKKGKTWIVQGAAGAAEYAAHLAGERGLGIAPVREDETCTWGLIDIDEGYDDPGFPEKLAVNILTHGHPLIPTASKSGGVHAWLFSESPVPAALMRKRLDEMAKALGYSKTEIFPMAGEGKAINLPYFGETRKAVCASGDVLSLEMFLDIAEGGIIGPDSVPRATAEWFDVAQPTRIPLARLSEMALRKIAKGVARHNAGKWFFQQMFYNNFSRVECEQAAEDFVEAINKAESGSSAYSLTKAAQQTKWAWLKEKKEPLDESNGDVGITRKLADAITAEASFATDAGGLLYVFHDGVYKSTGKRCIERKCLELCDQWGASKSWTPELAARVEARVAGYAPELWERPPLDCINVLNGLLDAKTRVLGAHDPKHLSPVQLPITFDPAATCPNINKFVSEAFPHDSAHLAWELAAWLMTPDTSIQKAVLLSGEGANGKSVFLALLFAFLGRGNCSALSLHRIEADKFCAARLVSKLCNIGSDLPTAALVSTSVFKAIVGGDVIPAERKFAMSFEFLPFARLVFSANAAPRSEDSSPGFFRRWLVIPFPNLFDESDPKTVPRAELDARLSQAGELSGLLNRALDALPVIRAGRFTETAATRAAFDEFRSTTDPLAIWLDQNTVDNPDGFEVKATLRAGYTKACQDAGRPILGDVPFTAALKRLRPKVRPSERRVNGYPTKVFLGLTMVTREYQEPPDEQHRFRQ